MTREELEILVTQSLDGRVTPGEQALVDRAIATDPEAARWAEEYRALDGLLKSAPLPEIDFERFGDRISAAVADSAGEAEAPVTYKMPRWVAWAAPIAAAACVAIVAGVWWSNQHSSPVGGGTSSVAVNSQAASSHENLAVAPSAPLVGSVQVAVMPAEPTVNTGPVGVVEIGPSAGMAQFNLPAHEALTPPRSTVAIDSAASNAQDSDRSLFR